jgi:hypothetical protein
MTISRYFIATILVGATALQSSFAGDAKVGDRLGIHEPKRLITGSGPQNNLERHRRAIANARHIERNAVGLLIERHERVPEPTPDVAGSRSVTPVASAPGPVSAAASHGVSTVAVKEDDSVARPDIVRTNIAPQAVVPALVSHSAINGTAMIRPAHAPAVIGGPAKTVASINGTTIRLRH